jgi:hypothetical protein
MFPCKIPLSFSLINSGLNPKKFDQVSSPLKIHFESMLDEAIYQDQYRHVVFYTDIKVQSIADCRLYRPIDESSYRCCYHLKTKTYRWIESAYLDYSALFAMDRVVDDIYSLILEAYLDQKKVTIDVHARAVAHKTESWRSPTFSFQADCIGRALGLKFLSRGINPYTSGIDVDSKLSLSYVL